MKRYLLLLPAALLVAACSKDPEPAVEMTTESVDQMTESMIEDAPPPASCDAPEFAVGETVEITPGLEATLLVEGAGGYALAGDSVDVHYTGWLFDPEAEDSKGAKFDSSVDRGALFSFPLGAGRVIRGWDEGVECMNRFSDRTTRLTSEVTAMGTMPGVQRRMTETTRIVRYCTPKATTNVAVSIRPIGGRMRRTGMTSGEVSLRIACATGL